jgi:hypothetical protein
VDNVSFPECEEFLKRTNALSKDKGRTYRLPTVDEWEYACRGGPGRAEDAYRFDFYLEAATRGERSDSMPRGSRAVVYLVLVFGATALDLADPPAIGGGSRTEKGNTTRGYPCS